LVLTINQLTYLYFNIMKNDFLWVILDTETDGLRDPIHVVEIAAQLMQGWVPCGAPFRRLLNHGVPIPPEAFSVHGYSEEYLQQHGERPSDVYRDLATYVKGYPVVAHNLSFDWNRCLVPEWQRLGLSEIGRRGFCTMTLSRRVLIDTSCHRLDVLKELYRLEDTKSHNALNDVQTLVQLFERQYKPRLESIGITSFQEIEQFSRMTPVARCVEYVRDRKKVSFESDPAEPKPIPARRKAAPSSIPANADAAVPAWYYLDESRTPKGPYNVSDICELHMKGRDAYLVWRAGLAEWIKCDSPDFVDLVKEEQGVVSAKKFASKKSLDQLAGLCRGVLADQRITTQEVYYLSEWLQDSGITNEWPASEVAEKIEKILEDGIVTMEEKRELQDLLSSIF
jgi:DNA polymerase III epsilon subunit-like protein